MKYTRNVYYIGNLEFARLVPGEAHFYNLDGDEIEKQTTEIKWDAEAAEKGGFEHFMMKEIHEQPKAVQDTFDSVIKNGTIDLSSVEITEDEIKNFEQIYIVACGSAWHVGMAAQYVLEDMADIPVRVELASEFRYRKMPVNQKALVIVVSQSGETADTLAALRLAKEKGITTLAVVNVVGSSIAREADKVFYTLAGPEISVATTKAYSAQLAATYCLAVQFAKIREKITEEQYSYYISEMLTIPEKMQKILEDKERIQWFAAKYANAHDVFFVGRGIDYAVCLEGSLKLKEVSYIHSEAYAAGELKHGTISLIEQGTLVIGVLTQSELYAKRKNLLMGSNPIIAPDSEMLWNAAIVWRILRRYEYTGALVMGRRKKIDVNTTSVRTLPEDKWIIAENAHAAIVTKDEYYQAQKAIRNVTPIQYKVGDDFALKGKICCGNCNRQLRHERQYGEMVFYCGYKRSAGKFSKCYGGYYREYSVNAKVARAIKTVFYALDVVNQGMQEKQSITVRCMDIEDLEKQAEAIRVEQIKLYESYADGVLLRDAYIEKKKALSEKLAALQDSIRTEKEEQECADELDEEIRALTKQASEKTYIGGLTKECVDAFVSMVYLYDDQTMKIEFNCEDVIRRALEKYGA